MLTIKNTKIGASHSFIVMVILFVTSTGSLISSDPTAVSSTAELSPLEKKSISSVHHFGEKSTRVDEPQKMPWMRG